MKNLIIGFLLMFLVGIGVNASHGAISETKKTEIVKVDLDHSEFVALENANTISNISFVEKLQYSNPIIFSIALNNFYLKYNYLDISPGYGKKHNCINKFETSNYNLLYIDMSPGHSRKEIVYNLVKNYRFNLKAKYSLLNWYRFNKLNTNQRNC